MAAVVFDARDFGAVPDDNVDDTAPINLAIKQAEQLGGGTVRLSAGLYRINSGTVSSPLRTGSNVTLEGTVSPDGSLQSTLFMPRGHSNRSLLVIGNTRYADEATDQVKDPEAVQTNVTVARLRFDLDNDHGRRAIQIRYRSRGVTIVECEGLQSGLDRGEAPDTTNRGDNHFLNLASYGIPSLGQVTEDVEIAGCRVTGGLQLTSDGGSGIINLRVRNNVVSRAFSHGIAITTVGKEALFRSILIENNQVLDIGGDALYLGHDEGVSRNIDLPEGGVHEMIDVIIRGNVFSLGANSGLYANGLRFGSFKQFSQIQIEGNRIIGREGGNTTSRFALTVYPWDLNYRLQDKYASINGSALQGDRLRMPGHPFVSGMQVEIQPRSVNDTLPQGLEAFRRYIVERIDSDQIALRFHRGGPLVRFAEGETSHSFDVVFSPAVEDVTMRDNDIEDVWDYGLRMDGSVRLTLDTNRIDGPMVLAGSHEGLAWRGNTFRRALSFASTGGSLLTAFSPETGLPEIESNLTANTWSIEEASTPVVYGIKGVVNFDPRDVRRTLAYQFVNNEILFAPGGASRYTYSLVDTGATGRITAVYSGNTYGRAANLNPSQAVSALESPLVYQPPVRQEGSSPASRLVNLSVRAQTAPGAPIIAGFTLAGTSSKTVLIRAVGPGLSRFGVDGVVDAPAIAVHAAGNVSPLATAASWESSSDVEGLADLTSAVGAFPLSPGSKDSALVLALAPGSYTAVVTGRNNTSGVALVEVYDGTPDDSTVVLTNLSARVEGMRGSAVPIIGFVVRGTASLPVLVRGAGPGLKQFLGGGTLGDPTLKLFASDATPFLTNDSWDDDPALRSTLINASQAVGAFPFVEGSKDAAALCSLAPGNYTALVTDPSGQSGTTLIEAYAVR